MENVSNALESLDDHWKEVSRALEVPSIEISKIEAEYRKNRSRLKAAIRFCYYRCPFTSWRCILAALDMMLDDSATEGYRDDIKKVHADIRKHAEKAG